MEYKSFENDSVTPSLQAPFFPEHLARYRFAQKLVQVKNVLELGCGKGYGAFAMAQVAKSVVACDLNEGSLNLQELITALKILNIKKRMSPTAGALRNTMSLFLLK